MTERTGRTPFRIIYGVRSRTVKLSRHMREQHRRELYKLSGRSESDRSLEVYKLLCSLSHSGFVDDRLRTAIDSGDWDTLVRIEPPKPESYDSSVKFGIDYMLAECLSKMAPSNTGAKPEELVRVAMDKFAIAEGQCRETNHRLLQEFRLLGSAELDPVVSRAQRKIAKVLGPFNWDDCSPYFKHGSGATTRLTRRFGDTYYKFRGIPDSTKESETLSRIAISLVKPWHQAEPNTTKVFWSEDGTLATEVQWPDLRIVIGNRITTVPKTAKTDRVIAKEPCMNMYIQQGIGKVIRKRLRKAGINLNDQGRNQSLSQIGSHDGSLATIDLSNASDTISIETVRILLPPDWFEPMNMVRSHYGVNSDGSVIRYQKFSTMGNGFTFELESLLFWALCSAEVDLHGGGDKRIGVYGDDLIVSTSVYEPLTYTLMRFGFTTNPKKSYATGPFRESCGKHWFMGRDVTPFYIREGVTDITRQLLVTNNVRRWMNRLYAGFIPPEAWSVYVAIRDLLVPKWVQENYKIPDLHGDGGVVSSFEEALPQRNRDGWEGWECLSFIEAPPSKHMRKALRVTGSSLMAKSLARLEYGLEPDDRKPSFGQIVSPEGDGVCSDELAITRPGLRLKLSKLKVSRWVDVGFPLI